MLASSHAGAAWAGGAASTVPGLRPLLLSPADPSPCLPPPAPPPTHVAVQVSKISLAYTFTMSGSLLLVGTLCSWHFYQLSVVEPLLRARRQQRTAAAAAAEQQAGQGQAAPHSAAESGQGLLRVAARSPRSRGKAAAAAAVQLAVAMPGQLHGNGPG